MIRLLTDYILSPLGAGTEANLDAVLRGETRLRMHHAVHGESLPDPFMASLMDELPEIDGYTPFEAMCIRALQGALEGLREVERGFERDDCVFILSTTKGNIWTSPAKSARKIARYFGNETTPIVVSTACTSGVSAQVLAYRLLMTGTYRTAVLIGCDVQSKFIVSGFQAFKALSPEPCRPFDAARNGLNAGETVAVMVLEEVQKVQDVQEVQEGWRLLGGSIHNDANHISAPSRTGEGSLRCLQDALGWVSSDDLAFVSVHGTGTNYNDEMESVALHRAGLDHVPVSALKGYYGHTMGAAGLTETILSIHAIDRGLIPPCKGYETQGTTYPVNLSTEARPTDKHAFIKLLSGFGGVNAAVAWEKTNGANKTNVANKTNTPYELHREVFIHEGEDLVAMYRKVAGNWPKFFKMDTLCRLGFVAVEQLLQDIKNEVDGERTTVILANNSASRANDADFQATIANPDNYFPSPALFVYTLPNIVTGEIAIRHHLLGETAFYVLEQEDDLQPIIRATMQQADIPNAIVGWIECSDKQHYYAHVQWITKQ